MGAKKKFHHYFIHSQPNKKKNDDLLEKYSANYLFVSKKAVPLHPLNIAEWSSW